MLESIYYSTQLNFPEDLKLQQYLSENL